MLDVVIKGGTIVDGTGGPSQQADLGIRDGRIVAVGAIDEEATQTIDASGKIVSPGFVDVHTHYDAQAFWDGTLSPSPYHGVTSVVGVLGFWATHSGRTGGGLGGKTRLELCGTALGCQLRRHY